jgi:hypothetical protein
MSQVGGTATGYPSEAGAPTVIDAYYSLLAEGGKLKRLPEEKQHFTRVDLDEALRILAQDDSKTISPAARYHALEQLARPSEDEGVSPERGLPGYTELINERKRLYHEFAATFAETDKEEQLVEHIHLTEGLRLPDSELLSSAARVIVDPSWMCCSEVVTVHDNAGTGELTLCLYGQFDSTADFKVLVGWLDPTTWPARGPLLFKSVKVVDPPGQINVPETGGQGWRGTYLEEVDLVGRRLETYLNCSYWSGGNSAALTYDLHESVGSELTVDRGYLSITPNPGGGHRVRALKLVAFKNGDEAVYEDVMCPTWTDCVQQAAESTAGSGAAGKAPPPSQAVPVTLDPEEFGRRWTECVSDASAAYTNFAVDVAQELVGGGYDMDDYRRHGMWLWTNLARDWSRAWVGTLEVAEQVARLDRGDPSGRPGPAPPLTTTVIVGTVDVKSNITVADLVGIGGNRRSIPASVLEVTPKEIEPGAAVTAAGTPGTEVTVTARITGVPPGLYRGELYAGSRTEPVLLYVSDVVRPARAPV